MLSKALRHLLFVSLSYQLSSLHTFYPNLVKPSRKKMKAKPVKPLRSSKSTPPPPVESRKITLLSSDGYPFEVHPIKLMGVP